MKCPHCGQETNSYRMAIMDLADGSKTVHEAADLLGKEVSSLRTMICNMKKEGYELNFKERYLYDPKEVENREETILDLYMEGMSLSKIGEIFGISGSRASQLKMRAVRRHRRAHDEKYKKYQEFSGRDW